MFAVPGWSVSPTLLKVQTKDPDLSQLDIRKTIVKPKLSTKKRKRNHSETKPDDLNPDNLANLWEEVIERNSKKKKGRKEVKPKTNKGSLDDATENLSAQPISQPENVKSENSVADVQKPIHESSVSHGLDVGNLREKFSKGVRTISTRKVKNQNKKREKTKVGRVNEEKQAELGTSTDKISKVEPKQDLDTEPSSKSIPPLTQLQTAMRQKLLSSRFRYLNETLYTVSSSHSMKLFDESPEMFTEYHEGFRRQVRAWPENPVDSYIAKIQKRGRIRESKKGNLDEKEFVSPLPRTGGTCTIADLGCGDAALSTSLQSQLENLRLKIHSFDLQSTSKLVTQADIANLPLLDGSTDVAIFCLALMGINWIDFIEEAFRILRWKGELWVAEIKSRFGRVVRGGSKIREDVIKKQKQSVLESKKEAKLLEEKIEDVLTSVEIDGMHNIGNETDVNGFVEVLRRRGFELQPKENDALNIENRMFVKMCFTKSLTPIKGKYVLASHSNNTGSNGETWKKKSKGKFIDDDTLHIPSEARVLKPCVYKLR